MKKVFLSLICLASIATASAQFSLGAKAGAQLTNLSGDGENADMKLGYYGGFYGRYQFAKNISAQAEVLYSAQGAKSDFEEGEVKFNYDYINVPVLFQYHLPVGVYFETGPQIGFLTKAEWKADEGKADVKDALKKTDFSWVAGAGYKITEELAVNARYNFGISDINDTDLGGKMHNNAIQLGISWKLFGK